MWQESLPEVCTTAAAPASSMPRKAWLCVSGDHAVDCKLYASAGSILESDGHGEAAGELTVRLALGGSGSYGAPRDEVGDVLRREGVEELGGGQGSPISPTSRRKRRARRRPSAMLQEPSRFGSLISPFHPTVVRGFSK